jgi:hypothetical protein
MYVAFYLRGDAISQLSGQPPSWDFFQGCLGLPKDDCRCAHVYLHAAEFAAAVYSLQQQGADPDRIMDQALNDANVIVSRILRQGKATQVSFIDKDGNCFGHNDLAMRSNWAQDIAYRTARMIAGGNDDSSLLDIGAVLPNAVRIDFGEPRLTHGAIPVVITNGPAPQGAGQFVTLGFPTRS